jgi:CHAT domain-containing protein
MRASFSAIRSALRNFRFLLPLLTLTALFLPMRDASAQQRELAAMNNRVRQLWVAGDKQAAIGLAEKSVELSKSSLGADNKITGILESQLGNFYRDVGRFADAERVLKAAIPPLEKGGNGPNFDLAAALNNLGGVYLNQDMFSEAEALFKRSLAIYEKLPAGKLRDTWRGNGINNLAVLYGTEANAKAESGQIDDASQAYDRMIAMLNEVIPVWSRAFGANHPNVANLLQNRGEAYSKKMQYDKAEADLREALKIRTQSLSPKNPIIATVKNNLANALIAEKKYPEAEELLKSALDIRVAALGPNHPSVARSLDALSKLYAANGNTAAAVDYSRKATVAVINHAATETLQVRQQQGAGGLIEQRAPTFTQHVANLAAANAAGPSPQLAAEAFSSAQWAVQSTTAAAVQQLGVRLASGGDAIAALVRENQDASALWRDRDRLLVGEMSKPEGQQNRAGIEALRQQIAQLENKQKTLQGRLETEFPDYVSLSNPKPLGLEDAQKLLGADEAMAFFLLGDKESYVFALTHDAFDWHVIPIGRKEMADKVAAFRRGLDVDELARSIADGKPVSFNVDTAYQLYSALLRPVEATVKDKKYLAIVPSGALTALPFHLLVTEQSSPGAADGAGRYRDAAWLLRRQAVAVLPSVASLKALRSTARADHGNRPFIGFGDPLFNAAPSVPGNRRGIKTRAYNEYWTRSGGIDRGSLAAALPQLADTSEEIKNIAARLGASASDIFLGKDASETAVKKAQLADYRVVYFATHGLVAGDVRGVGEPALVLSIPANPTEADDGLLTSSEVAQLKLNADWVVLSACNTMAGDKPGAEALSGLARAFFYAGSRALLVSHWTVESNAATRLTISIFDVLSKDPALGRAEAVRRAMLAFLSDTSNDDNANPAYWGPFSVVGEGAEK